MKLPPFVSDLLLQLAYASLTHIASRVAEKISKSEHDRTYLR